MRDSDPAVSTAPKSSASTLARPGSSTAFRVASVASAAAALVIFVSTLFAGNLLALPFAAWSLLPYLFLLLAARWISDPWVVGGAGALALAIEIGIRAAVFIFPSGSTAAIALVYSPVMIAMLLPVGAGSGFVLGRLWRRFGLVTRSVISVVSASLLGLTTLGLARPDLFPTTVLERNATLSRIGEPRIEKGEEAFETSVIPGRSAWVTVGDLDGDPGDEIAVITHQAAELFDPQSLESRGRIEFAWKDRSPLGISTLVLLDGQPVVVQTGGGYSNTEVLDLEGNLLWRYRPDPELPPTALRPADLDGDGKPELYSSHLGATARLDWNGHEVWSRPTKLATLIALVRRTERTSAWVVGEEYGRLARIWDENGESLAELPLTEKHRVVGAVDWPDERALVLAGDGARGIGLDGKTLFEMPLADMTLIQAISVRFRVDDAPYLVLAAAAERLVERWRLLIVSPARETVYDEIFDRPIGLLAAHCADGSEALVLSGGEVLVVRPRS